MEIETIDSPKQELIDFFQTKIDEFNVARWEVKEKVPVAIRVKNKNGDIVAGAAARTFGLWLLIDNIWVCEELRGQNVGSKILIALEDAATQRGCKFSLLDTLSFQAKPFYEKFGYTVQWVQNNYPKDGCKYFMVKNLSK
jgi:GNAT superfamily N-acetyltransferase